MEAFAELEVAVPLVRETGLAEENRRECRLAVLELTISASRAASDVERLKIGFSSSILDYLAWREQRRGSVVYLSALESAADVLDTSFLTVSLVAAAEGGRRMAIGGRRGSAARDLEVLEVGEKTSSTFSFDSEARGVGSWTWASA